MTEISSNYLEKPYLNDQYLLTLVEDSQGAQFSANILDRKNSNGSQFNAVILSSISQGQQISGAIGSFDSNGSQISTNIVAKHESFGSQFYATLSPRDAYGTQFQAEINSHSAKASQSLASVLNKEIANAFEIRAEILNALRAIGAQFQSFIGVESEARGTQFTGVINSLSSRGAESKTTVINKNTISVQYHGYIVDRVYSCAQQFLGDIHSSLFYGAQINAVVNEAIVSGAQFKASIIDRKLALGSNFLFNYVTHIWRGYLWGDYLSGPYLMYSMEGWLRAQFKAIINKKTSIGAQFSASISYKKKHGAQFIATIEKTRSVGTEFDSVLATALGGQFRSILYNTSNLRILWQFPSRGTTPGSWTANSTEPGDFGADNLNTDIVEQVWRSQSGTKSGIKLVCDTGLPQGTYMDTLAILNHNLSKSASVLLEGSDDPTFTTSGFVHILQPIEVLNTYYIAPELPLNGYRYWRISIDDVTNVNSYLQIGTIIFGQATIWSGECFSNPVRYSKIHYVDQVQTEGFTNISNDRGIKKKLGLDFQSINFSGGNYETYVDMIDTIRTSHKALWIPTPDYASRYATFGKLTEIPSESHTDNGENADYVSFSVEVDEAK